MSPLVKPVSLLGGVRLPVYSLQLDGSSGLKVAWATQNNIDTVTGDFTLEAWVKWTALPAIQSDFFNRQLGGFPVYLLYGFHSGVRKITISMEGDTVRWVWTPTLDVWYHVACVCSGSSMPGQFRFVLDGTDQGTGTATSSVGGVPPWTWGGSGDIGIGIQNTFTTNALTGRMMDVRLWNVAKSAAQIDAARKSFLVGNESNLISNWQMQEGTGTTAADSHANGNDGVFAGSGTASWSSDVPDWS